jgi:acyl-CoA synthetase (AMP-forming)/AMP-acid ligase II
VHRTGKRRGDDPLPMPRARPARCGTTRKAMRRRSCPFPGYYETGDAGHFDAEGFLNIMGRTDDIINVAGHRLSTGADGADRRQPSGVAECAVIGADDALKGMIPIGICRAESRHQEARCQYAGRDHRPCARRSRAGGRAQGCAHRRARCPRRARARSCAQPSARSPMVKPSSPHPPLKMQTCSTGSCVSLLHQARASCAKVGTGFAQKTMRHQKYRARVLRQI